MIGTILKFVASAWSFFVTKDAQDTGQKLNKEKQQEVVIANVEIAQHVDNDVSLNGPLADFVRQRAGRS